MSNEQMNEDQLSNEQTNAEPAIAQEPIAEKVNFATPPADFDWSNTGKAATETYKAEEKSTLEAMYDKTLGNLEEHQIVMGKVIGLTDKEAVINIGFKSDGLIPLGEFRHMPDIKPGDEVEVFVETREDKAGQLILSHKKARALKSWERVNSALEKDEIIQGFVKCRTKGGLIVDVFGIEAFLPGSQIDVKPIRDYDIFVGKTMEFKVVKINNEFKNVVVSHKVLIEQELESQKTEIMSKLEKGQVLEGTVKNITSYGVFMDLGGVDGLLHITDISWGRISHPEEILKLDDKINVVILDFDEGKKRIALGLKQLTPQPWDSLSPDLKAGDKIKGKVVVLTDYGAFVEVSSGVEGLIHVSEMSWSQHLRSPQDFLKSGDEIEAVILNVDREERKMSLGLKQLTPDPWTVIDTKYTVGSKHTAKVRNFTNFGVFVELEEGIDGLIHISDLSWNKKIKHPSEFTKVGEMIECIVLDVDKEHRRLSLGHKQLLDNPWDTYETIFTVGSVHDGVVGKVTDKGSHIMFTTYGVEGHAQFRQLSKENGSVARQDETLPFKVTEFLKDAHKIYVSHARTWDDKIREEKVEKEKERGRERDDAGKQVKKLKDSMEKSTLGDLDVLSQLKSDMETSERKGKAVAKAKADTEEETPPTPVADATPPADDITLPAAPAEGETENPKTE